MEVNAKVRNYAEGLVKKGLSCLGGDMSCISENDAINAMKYFNMAIEADSEFSQPYSLRGALLIYLAKYREAVDDFSKAIELNPYAYVAYIMRGQLYSGLSSTTFLGFEIDENEYLKANLQDISEAITDFSTAIAIKPDEAVSYFERGKCHSALKDYKFALEDFDTAILYKPAVVDFYFARIKCYLALSNLDEEMAGRLLKQKKEQLENMNNH